MDRRGNRPPSEDVLPFLRDGLLDQLPEPFALGRISRQKDIADAVVPCGRQADAERIRDLSQKAIRGLNEDAGAIARVGLTAARAAMLKVDEHLEPALDDGVRTESFYIDDEADAACVVLEAGVIQALGLRRCSSESRSSHRMRPCAQGLSLIRT